MRSRVWSEISERWRENVGGRKASDSGRALVVLEELGFWSGWSLG